MYYATSDSRDFDKFNNPNTLIIKNVTGTCHGIGSSGGSGSVDTSNLVSKLDPNEQEMTGPLKLPNVTLTDYDPNGILDLDLNSAIHALDDKTINQTVTNKITEFDNTVKASTGDFDLLTNDSGVTIDMSGGDVAINGTTVTIKGTDVIDELDTKVSGTDTADQTIVSNLTLTDNTKKISANLETAAITVDGTFLRIRDSLGTVLFQLANFPSCLINGDTTIAGELQIYHPTESLISIKANTKFYNFKVNSAGTFVLDSFPNGVLMSHEITADEIKFYKTVTTTKTGNFTDDQEFIPKSYADNVRSALEAQITGVSTSLGDKISKTDTLPQSMTSTLHITNNTASTNPAQGALRVQGGMGIVGKIFNADGISTEGDLNVGGIFQTYGTYGLISAVSADLDDNGISTASTFDSTSYPYNAFDQIINTFWQSGQNTYQQGTNNYLGSVSTIVDGVAQLGEWVQIALKNILLTDKISLRATNKAPLSWVLAGSMDGSTWFTLKDETNVQLTGTYYDATFPTTKTKYVRLIVRLVKNDNFPRVIVDNIDIYGTPTLTIEDGVLSGEINASTIHSGFIRTHHLIADNVITDYVDSPNVSKIAKISFPRNQNNSALGFYNDDYIGLGWDGSRDFRVRIQSSSYTGVYASGIVPEDSALYQNGTKNRLLTSGFQIFFRINAGTTGFVMFDITSSDDDNFPAYKVIFRINTATTTDIVNCIVERYG